MLGIVLCKQIADESQQADYCWVDLMTEGEDILELAENLGGLEGSNGGEPQIHIKVCSRGDPKGGHMVQRLCD